MVLKHTIEGYEDAVKNVGDLLDVANRPGFSSKSSLDFTAGDFSFFKPYEFGEFTSSEITKSEAHLIPSSSEYTNDSVSVATITKLDLSCNATDLEFVDFSGCNPSDPSFLSLWGAENPLVNNNATPSSANNATPSSSNNATHSSLMIKGNIHVPTDLKKQCFRSHYCANSYMSKTLAMMNQYSSGMEKRFLDLEDMYFRTCLQLFNYVLAIVLMIWIIISQVSYTSKSIPIPSPKL
jgi:hypothetical protein